MASWRVRKVMATWTIRPSRKTSGIILSFFLAVCLAVSMFAYIHGEVHAASPENPLWTDIPLTNVTPGMFLSSVTLSPTDAWVVGSGASANINPYIEHWDGSQWTMSQPAFGVGPFAISAVSPDDIWIVGGYAASMYDVNTFAAEHWDGHTWTYLPVSNDDGLLTSVVAVASTDVWAAGISGTSNLLEHWDGASWQPVPSPAFYIDGFYATSSSDVWAAGTLAGPNYVAKVAHWDGSQWTTTALPDTTASPARAISGAATNDIWAVGGSATWHWDGTNWNVVPNPVPANTCLQSVTEVSSTDAWAVGDTGGCGSGSPLIEHWDGTQWNVTSTIVSNHPGIDPRTVSSDSQGDLWAAGGQEVAPNTGIILQGITNSPPSITPLPNVTLTVGSTYTASGSFTDPDSTSWTGTVDYGDGSGTQPLALSGMSFSLNHTYTSPGVYSVSVMVTDNQGATGSATWTVTVNAPPTITSASSTSTGMRVPFSITITTTGSPTPSLSESGALPTGVSFADNGDGTATLAGEAAAGSSGIYPLTLTATNGVGAPASQAFTLTVTTTTSAPVITSANADTETFGVPFSFTVTTDGYPVPTLSKSGALPLGVTFDDNGDGTATIAGTPSASAAGVYALTLKAKSTVAIVTQSFTLTIVKAPVFKVVTIPVGHVGSPYTLTLKTSAYNTASLTENGSLPEGLTFTDNGDGTATIAGTPLVGSGGAYRITVTATNALGSSTKAFTLKVDEAATITSDNSATATVGQSFTFTVTATGYPTPTIAKGGPLPKGLTYQSATHTISGTPAPGSQGTYLLVFTAKNSSGTVQQAFTLSIS